VLFSNFGKTVTDLFKTKKYELNRTVSVKNTSGNTEWTTEVGFPVTEEGKSDAKVLIKQSHKNYGNLELEVSKSKPNKVDYRTPNLAEGLKTNIVIEEKKDGKVGMLGDIGMNLALKVEYEKGNLAGKICAENEKLSAEGAIEYRGAWFGGEATFSVDGWLRELLCGVHYQMGDTQLDLKMTCKSLNIKTHKQYCSTGEVAAEFETDIKTFAPKCSLGGKWKLDEKCTTQGFLTSEGNAYLLYKHKLTERLTASLGTSFDVSNLHGENVNIHYKLEMEA